MQYKTHCDYSILVINLFIMIYNNKISNYQDINPIPKLYNLDLLNKAIKHV